MRPQFWFLFLYVVPLFRIRFFDGVFEKGRSQSLFGYPPKGNPVLRGDKRTRMTLRPGRVQQIHKRENRGVDRSSEPFRIDKLTRRSGLITLLRPAFEPGYTDHMREIYPQWGIGVSTCIDNGKQVKHPRLRFDHYVDLVKVWEDHDFIYVEDMYVDVLLYERSYYHVIDLEEFGEALTQRQVSTAEAKRVLENTQQFVDAMKRSRLSYVLWKQKYGVHHRLQ